MAGVVAGWLALLTGGRGGSRMPQTKGTLAPRTPEQQQWGTLMKGQNPNCQSPVGETTGAPERVGPRPQHPRGPFGFVPASQESSCPAWTPQTPPSPIHELLARLVFQGSGGRQKGPTLRTERGLSQMEMGGTGESQLSPRRGREAPLPRWKRWRGSYVLGMKTQGGG